MKLFRMPSVRTTYFLLLTLLSVIAVRSQEDIPCECVPYFLCQGENNTISTDGADLISVRNRAGNPCSDPLATCCNIPPEFRTTTTTTTPPPLPETTPQDTKGFGTTTTTEIPPIPPVVIIPSRSCGVRRELPTSSRIVSNNGVDTGATYYAEFPWMIGLWTEVRVQDSIHYKFKCGGSLINPRVVVTAAHCVVGVNQNLLNIRAGEWNTQNRDEPLPHQDRKVETIAVHPQFNPRNLRYDIAVVIVDRPYDITDNVDMICLPPQPEFSNFDNSRCVATGWGKDSDLENSTFPNILRKVDLPIVPPTECQTRLRNTTLSRFFLLHDSFTCAGGEPGKDTCQGDGGGPLFCPLPQDNTRWAQVGITSWGIGCGGNIPAVYTNVVNFVNWIIDQIPIVPDDAASPADTPNANN